MSIIRRLMLVAVDEFDTTLQLPSPTKRRRKVARHQPPLVSFLDMIFQEHGRAPLHREDWEAPQSSGLRPGLTDYSLKTPPPLFGISATMPPDVKQFLIRRGWVPSSSAVDLTQRNDEIQSRHPISHHAVVIEARKWPVDLSNADLDQDRSSSDTTKSTYTAEKLHKFATDPMVVAAVGALWAENLPQDTLLIVPDSAAKKVVDRLTDISIPTAMINSQDGSQNHLTPYAVDGAGSASASIWVVSRSFARGLDMWCNAVIILGLDLKPDDYRHYAGRVGRLSQFGHSSDSSSEVKVVTILPPDGCRPFELMIQDANITLLPFMVGDHIISDQDIE